MSFVIRASGADLSAYANPKLYATLAIGGVNSRIPSDHLVGAYLFEDGTVGQDYAGAVPDLSGHGHDASRVLSAAPVKRSYGVEVTDVDGLVLDTGIVTPKAWTAIAAIRNNFAAPSVQFPTWAYPGDAPGSSGWPTAKNNSYGGSFKLFPVMWNNNNTWYNRHAIEDPDSSELGTTPVALTTADAPSTSWNVVAFKTTGQADASNGSVELVSVNGGTTGVLTRTQLHNIWDAANGAGRHLFLGLWPFQTQRPCTGEIGGFLVYDTVLDAESCSAAMRALAARMEARGVDVYGYVG